MRGISVFIIFLLVANFTSAQNKYWVSFTDKANEKFDPYSYFDERTIAQRIAQHIPLNDITDYPVSAIYLNLVSQIADSLSWPSRLSFRRRHD